MSAINDGGPAFPAQDWQAKGNHHPGMTLRDWFAGQVDVAVYNPLESFVNTYGKQPTFLELADWTSGIRYTEADAMLAARKGGGND